MSLEVVVLVEGWQGAFCPQKMEGAASLCDAMVPGLCQPCSPKWEIARIFNLTNVEG